jgi:hypothetical protein
VRDHNSQNPENKALIMANGRKNNYLYGKEDIKPMT